MVKRTSGLSMPIPKALVATRIGSSLFLNRRAVAVLCSSQDPPDQVLGLAPEYTPMRLDVPDPKAALTTSATSRTPCFPLVCGTNTRPDRVVSPSDLPAC